MLYPFSNTLFVLRDLSTVNIKRVKQGPLGQEEGVGGAWRTWTLLCLEQSVWLSSYTLLPMCLTMTPHEVEHGDVSLEALSLPCRSTCCYDQEATESCSEAEAKPLLSFKQGCW